MTVAASGHWRQTKLSDTLIAVLYSCTKEFHPRCLYFLCPIRVLVCPRLLHFCVLSYRSSLNSKQLETLFPSHLRARQNGHEARMHFSRCRALTCLFDSQMSSHYANLQYFRIAQRRFGRLRSSRMWFSVAGWMFPEVSKDRNSFTFKAQGTHPPWTPKTTRWATPHPEPLPKRQPVCFAPHIMGR